MFVFPYIVNIIRNWCNFWFIYLYPISSTCFGRSVTNYSYQRFADTCCVHIQGWSSPWGLKVNTASYFSRLSSSYLSLNSLLPTSNMCQCWNILRRRKMCCVFTLTHWGRVTQICVFNTRLFSLHNTLNYAMHRTCLRMVLLTDVYKNLTSHSIKL